MGIICCRILYFTHPESRQIGFLPRLGNLLFIHKLRLTYFSGLKGQYKSAQGNALGIGNTTKTVRVSMIIKAQKLHSDGIESYHFLKRKG